MIGKTTALDEPAFDLDLIRPLFEAALATLVEQGFTFAKRGGLSGAVRQHDQAIISRSGALLMPAQSWQSNLATSEVELLRKQGAEEVVGRIEERFVLPKLLRSLNLRPSLRNDIGWVMTTGDWIALQLTGQARLIASDALSNGLLCQATRKIADAVLEKAGINPEWFPPVIRSGKEVGVIGSTGATWIGGVFDLIKNWLHISSLGDNHAGAVGSGLDDLNTIVASFGTSGTAVRKTIAGLPLLHSNVLQFEYYRDRLLLSMLPDCGSWWGRFSKEYGEGRSDKALDQLAMEAGGYVVLENENSCDALAFKEQTLANKVASVQMALVTGMLQQFRQVHSAVNDPSRAITRAVVTGGLSRSPLIRREFAKALTEEFGLHDVFVSALEGPEADQAAVRGALINALVGTGVFPDIASAAKVLCPLVALD